MKIISLTTSYRNVAYYRKAPLVNMTRNLQLGMTVDFTRQPDIDCDVIKSKYVCNLDIYFM